MRVRRRFARQVERSPTVRYQPQAVLPQEQEPEMHRLRRPIWRHCPSQTTRSAGRQRFGLCLNLGRPAGVVMGFERKIESRQIRTPNLESLAAKVLNWPATSARAQTQELVQVRKPPRQTHGSHCL